MNIKESFTYLFKEKNWVLKFLPIYLFTLLNLGVSLLLTNALSSAQFFISGHYEKQIVYDPSLWIYIVISLILLVPTILLSSWYHYENMQAGMQDRETNAIWKNPGDSLKKSLKYIAANFVYGFLLALILIVMIVAFVAFFYAIRSVFWPNSSQATLGAVTLVLVCVWTCVFIFVVVIASLIGIFIQIAQMKLVSTNTFKEAFNFKQIGYIYKKYFVFFLALLGAVLVYAFVVGVPTVIFDVFARFFNNIPVVKAAISFVFYALLTLFTTYIALFVYPRILGQMWRWIQSKEAK
jgi:hypothetical protein